MKKWIAFALLPVIYGSSFMFIEIAVRQITPIELTAFRFGLGGLALLAVVFLRGSRIPLDASTVRSLIIIGLLNNTAPFLLIAWAQQQNVGTGLTGVLVAMNPLFTLVVAHFAFADERITWPKVAGVSAGFAGVIVLASRNIEGGEVLTEGLLGQGAVVLSAFCFAAAGVFSRKLLQGRISDPMVVAAGTATTATISTLILWGVVLLGGTPITPVSTLTMDTIGSVLLLSVVHTFVAFNLLYYIIRELGVTRTSTIAYIIPIVSLLIGAVFLNEVIDARVLLGTAIILSGIAIVNVSNELGKWWQRVNAASYPPSPRI